MALTAGDVMTARVIIVSPWTGVEELARVLAGSRISGAPVVDDHGRLVGIVSEADILGRALGEDTVRAIMTPDVIAVSERESLQEVSLLLSVRRINRVPVLRDGKVVGIVSRSDIVRAVAGLLPAERPGPSSG